MATNSLINGIRERLAEAGRTLFAWPAKFRLPSASTTAIPPSRLAFVARHESIRAYLGIAERRMAPLANELRDGETLRMTHMGGDRYRLDARSGTAPQARHLPDWILTEESEAGNVARLSFDERLEGPGRIRRATCRWRWRASQPSKSPTMTPGTVIGSS